MWRFMRAIKLFFSGRMSEATAALFSNKYVVEATFDEAKDREIARYNTVKQSFAKITGIRNELKVSLDHRTERFEKAEKLMKAAGAAAKRFLQEQKDAGVTDIEIVKKNPIYLKHLSTFNDARSTADELKKTITEDMDKVEKFDDQLEDIKRELMDMERRLKKLEAEKAEGVAKLEISKSLREVQELTKGLGASTTNKDLAAARQAIKDAENMSQVTIELSGNRAAAEEDRLLAEYDLDSASGDFDNLVGLNDFFSEEKKVEEELPSAKVGE